MRYNDGMLENPGKKRCCCQHFLLSCGLILVVFLQSCADKRPLLEKIKTRGELVVITRNSPTTYYEGPFGSAGMEYDLAKKFAEYLNVKLKLVLKSNIHEVLQALEDKENHIAAAGISISEQRRIHMRFSPGYQKVSQKLVFRSRTGRRAPRKISDIIGSDIEVSADSTHVELLTSLKKEYPRLNWNESQSRDSDELLELVWLQLIDYTIANSNEITLSQRLMPELAVGFNLKKDNNLAWALPLSEDDSLYNEVKKFFKVIKEDGTLKAILYKNYGHVRKFNYVDTQFYIRDITNKLPEYIDAFKTAAWENKLDWRLLAAVGYQESLWNPHAISPTGVRGLMMLTTDTAKFVGIKDRRDPVQSIMGGAKYLRYMIDKIPLRIEYPDRIWMGLAAYNVGYGHLEDARKLTEKRGGNPDKWVDIKETLPLLSQRKWFSQTKHGYARGREPVVYVENIRNYHELLAWYLASDAPGYKPVKKITPIIENISPAL